jgi:hypothetical protein
MASDEDRFPHLARYEWLIDGFRRSVARLREVAYADDLPPVESYIPLFEALNWAHSIAWRLGKGNEPELLMAIEYARNAVHHEWIRTLELMPRGYGEGGYGEGPYGGWIWRWRTADDLQVRKADDRRSLYESFLAGRFVLDTLRQLEAELPDEHA